MSKHVLQDPEFRVRLTYAMRNLLPMLYGADCVGFVDVVDDSDEAINRPSYVLAGRRKTDAIATAARQQAFVSLLRNHGFAYDKIEAYGGADCCMAAVRRDDRTLAGAVVLVSSVMTPENRAAVQAAAAVIESMLPDEQSGQTD